jgi:hypothetical protein
LEILDLVKLVKEGSKLKAILFTQTLVKFVEAIRHQKKDRRAKYRGILVSAPVVGMCKSVPMAILLSQLGYWHPKASIQQEHKLWVAKTYDEWARETFLTPRTCRSAVQSLVASGLVEKGNWKFRGQPCLHLRIVEEEYTKQYEANCRRPRFKPCPKQWEFERDQAEGEGLLGGT